MFDSRRLRLLVEFERRGTVAAVADALSYTPSAVSQQLATLEREAGGRLFERAGRTLLLTDFGRLLAGHGARVLDALEQAEAELEAAGGEVGGVVRVSSFQTVGMVLLPSALRTLHERHPRVAVEFLDAEAEETFPLLVAGEIDLVIAEEYEHAPRARDPRHDRRTLCRDALFLALPADDPLARRKTVSLDRLADHPWASARPGTAYHDMIVRACRSIGGFEPRVRHSANDVIVMFRLVEAGAVTIVPALGAGWAPDGVAIRPIARHPLEREIFSVARATSAGRPALEAVRTALDESVEEMRLATY
jgi:DNA-binding transcriptional LysR family regulator